MEQLRGGIIKMYRRYSIIENFCKKTKSNINKPEHISTLIECSNKLIRKYVPEKYLERIELIDFNDYYIKNEEYKYYITICLSAEKLCNIIMLKQNGYCTSMLNQTDTCEFIIDHVEDIKKYLLQCVDKFEKEDLQQISVKQKEQNCLQKLNALIEGDLHEGNK